MCDVDGGRKGRLLCYATGFHSQLTVTVGTDPGTSPICFECNTYTPSRRRYTADSLISNLNRATGRAGDHVSVKLASSKSHRGHHQPVTQSPRCHSRVVVTVTGGIGCGHSRHGHGYANGHPCSSASPKIRPQERQGHSVRPLLILSI